MNTFSDIHSNLQKLQNQSIFRIVDISKQTLWKEMLQKMLPWLLNKDITIMISIIIWFAIKMQPYWKPFSNPLRTITTNIWRGYLMLNYLISQKVSKFQFTTTSKEKRSSENLICISKKEPFSYIIIPQLYCLVMVILSIWFKSVKY